MILNIGIVFYRLLAISVLYIPIVLQLYLPLNLAVSLIWLPSTLILVGYLLIRLDRNIVLVLKQLEAKRRFKTPFKVHKAKPYILRNQRYKVCRLLHLNCIKHS